MSEVNFNVYAAVEPLVSDELLRVLRHIALEILKEEGQSGELNIALVDEQEMIRLNSLYKSRDYATDVLSFSYIYTVMGDFPRSLGSTLGDIAICVDTALRNAEFYGNSFEKEMCLLVIHGVLQVLGYNHETGSEEDREIFEQKQIYYEGKLCSDL